MKNKEGLGDLGAKKRIVLLEPSWKKCAVVTNSCQIEWDFVTLMGPCIPNTKTNPVKCFMLVGFLRLQSDMKEYGQFLLAKQFIWRIAHVANPFHLALRFLLLCKHTTSTSKVSQHTFYFTYENHLTFYLDIHGGSTGLKF